MYSSHMNSEALTKPILDGSGLSLSQTLFLVNEFFWFFNMMFLNIFRSDLQKIVEKGSNFEGLKKQRDLSNITEIVVIICKQKVY